MKYLILIFLTIPTVLYSQSLEQLSKYVSKRKIVDYGYGMWFDEGKAQKKYFNFNHFLSEQLFFSVLNFEQDSVQINTIKLSGFDKLSINSNKSLYFNSIDTMIIDTISSIVYQHDTLNHSISMFSSYTLDKIYFMKLKTKNYVVVYLKKITVENPFQNTIAIYKGFLIDLNKKIIIELPEEQSTNSILCFADYNRDNCIDYININIYGNSNTVNFYILEKEKFIKDQYYIKYINFIDMPFIQQSFLPKGF